MNDVVLSQNFFRSALRRGGLFSGACELNFEEERSSKLAFFAWQGLQF